MGFFSKLCAVSNLPVIAQGSGLGSEVSSVVALTPNGSVITGIYDGYGCVGEVDVYSTHCDEWDEVKFVLAKFYEGQTYEDLGPSHDDPGQGFFYEDALVQRLHAAGGFPSARHFFAAWQNDFEDSFK